jgi:hypothetical protein
MSPFAAWTLTQEARALQTRLGRVRPFALLEPMVPAAALLPQAQSAIDEYLVAGRRSLRAQVQRFIDWVRGPGRYATNAQGQRRFSMLRLKFNAVLTQFDLFSDVITQRSEHETGVWLSGLDVASADALALHGSPVEVPPVICYLDRGAGAAIRRARTRLPGGGTNPVAIIRLPRERMVGAGIASSLFHEVGHQADALLRLSESLRPVLHGMQRGRADDAPVWQYLERCISEIVADFFSIARVGIASSMGLISVVSLPRAFVFRLNLDDPHPVPWIRVQLSCAIGEALHPHPQWRRLSDLWESLYPIAELDAARRVFFERLLATIPVFVSLLVNHRPAALRGRSLVEALEVADRQPARLGALFHAWSHSPTELYDARASLVFAVVGQARSDGRLSPEDEALLLARALTHWALRSTLDTAFACARTPSARRRLRSAMVRRERFMTIQQGD